MTSGQTRVLVLLLLLGALEMVVHPGIKQWLSGAINAINATLNTSASKG